MTLMKGYDRDEALAFILKGLDRKLHRELESKLDVLISQAIDADMAYMVENHVINEAGEAGDAYYDDDDAFEYMLDAIVCKNKFNADTAMKVASLLDDYMDLQQAYLEAKGLVDWD